MNFALFTTGGTIASVPSGGGLKPGLSGEDLLRLCPDLMGFEHEINVFDLMSKDSTDMQPSDWLVMSEGLRAHTSGFDAAVLLHGTDTMTWTAAALSFLLSGLRAPVVMTGSMLTRDDPGNDISGNIFSAVQFAMQLAMYQRGGVAIAFDGHLIHGVRAAKIDSRRKHAFVSVDYPLLGEMKDRGTHQIAWLNAQKPRLSSERPWGTVPAFGTDIALLPVFPGMPARLLDSVIDAQPGAIVLEGYGLGGIPLDANANETKNQGGSLLCSIQRAIENDIPVIVRTQSLFGGTNLNVYEVGQRARDLGVLSAGNMTREALMVKLALALPLCGTDKRDGLEAVLKTNFCDETGEF